MHFTITSSTRAYFPIQKPIRRHTGRCLNHPVRAELIDSTAAIGKFIGIGVFFYTSLNFFTFYTMRKRYEQRDAQRKTRKEGNDDKNTKS